MFKCPLRSCCPVADKPPVINPLIKFNNEMINPIINYYLKISIIK